MKLFSVLISPLLLLACGGQIDIPEQAVNIDMKKLCQLCPQKECPPEKECPNAEEVYKPVCDPEKNFTSGCWHNPGSGWQYISCPAAEPSKPTCSDVLCPEGYECKSNSDKVACVKKTVEPPPGNTDPNIKESCGMDMPEGASTFSKIKPYGQGQDTELNVLNWPELCYFIHGNPVNPNQCHLEGLDSKGYSRVKCEMAIIYKLSNGAGKCHVGVWKNSAHPDEQKCLERNDDPTGMSCDHFGNTVTRDDPNTVPFEGMPTECGELRDDSGNPKSGFFWVTHGKGEVKACLPNYTNCSRQWLSVDH